MGRKTTIIILSTLILVGIICFFTFRTYATEEYFSPVELSENNSITNSNGIRFYDTIISVGLDEAGIKGANLVVSELTNSAKDQFGSGELKAHIRYFNGTFYLFIDKFGRNEAIEVICHEIIHMVQYSNGQLSYENGEVYWEGQPFDLENIEYDRRPWERDAFSRQSNLYSKVYGILYN